MSKGLDWRRAKKFREAESIADEPRIRDRLDARATGTLRKWAAKQRKLSDADRKLLVGEGG